MNDHFPNRPQVREEQESPKETKTREPFSIISGKILGYLVCIILLYTLSFYWPDRKESKTRETMIEWIDTIDRKAQEDISTLILDPYILPDKDAWGNDIEVTCTTEKNSYMISMLSPGDEDIISDDVYEGLVRNTKTNEVIRFQPGVDDFINPEISIENNPEPEKVDVTNDKEPAETQVAPTETTPSEADTPGFKSKVKEASGDVADSVKTNARKAKRGIKGFINKRKNNSDTPEAESPAPEK